MTAPRPGGQKYLSISFGVAVNRALKVGFGLLPVIGLDQSICGGAKFLAGLPRHPLGTIFLAV